MKTESKKVVSKETQPVAKQTTMFKSENCLTISPKTVPFDVFHLKDLNPSSIEDMIKVLDKSPKVKFEGGKMQMFFSPKFPVLFANCVINYDTQKNIIWIKPFDEVEKSFNILK